MAYRPTVSGGMLNPIRIHSFMQQSGRRSKIGYLDLSNMTYLSRLTIRECFGLGLGLGLGSGLKLGLDRSCLFAQPLLKI